MGKRAYTFSDLLEVKAARELLNAGIPLQRVRKNLRALRAALPEEPHPLIRISCDGETLHVAEGEAAFNPLSGQLLLDFGIDDIRAEISSVLHLLDRSKEAGQTESLPEIEAFIRRQVVAHRSIRLTEI